uniref:Uncharacterized protein n=1 Tax=Romanomermis culicivorax TaxID=13658 RepID=A0A915HFD3_ROMCU
MARNAEKAMTALARWHKMKLEEERGPIQRRPAFTKDCKNVRDAEKWRMQIIRDIAKKIAQIQNPGLGEFRIRDLNDEINKLLKIKHGWECRIVELGGPDYKRIAPKMLDREGREVPGNRGYKYFGAAKDLPGVRELFEKPPQDSGRKNRTELARFVDAEYYGYMDDDDGVLIPLEQEVEKCAVAEAVREWELCGGGSGETAQTEELDWGIYKETNDELDEYFSNFPHLHCGPLLKSSVADDQNNDDQPKFIAHVEVPSQKDVEEALLRRKKMDLLEKYAGETLTMQNMGTNALLGGYAQTENKDKASG